MILADDAAIARIARGVMDCSLPKPQWTHAAHFALALWICRHRRDLMAAEAMRALISGYNVATNTLNTDTGGYHHTITLASMRAADDHLRRIGPDVTLADALSSLIASPLGRPDWVLAHWRRETLFSREARHAWRDPDLAPLPF